MARAKYRAEVETIRQKIEAANVLENFCSIIRSTLQEEELQGKIEGSNKVKIEKAAHLRACGFLPGTMCFGKKEVDASAKTIAYMLQEDDAVGSYCLQPRVGMKQSTPIILGDMNAFVFLDLVLTG